VSSASKGRFVHHKLTISSSNNTIVVRVGGSDYNATVTAGDYFLRNDGVSSTDGGDLAVAVKTALDNSGSGLTYTLAAASHSGSTRGFQTVSATGTFILKWSSGSASFPELYLGFATNTDTASGTSATGTLCPLQLWYPETEGILLDNDTEAVVLEDESTAGVVDTRTLATYDVQDVTFDFVDRANVKNAYRAATHLAFDYFWEDARGGGDFVYFPDNTDTSTVGRWVIADRAWKQRLSNAAEVMSGVGGERYRIRVPMRERISSS